MVIEIVGRMFVVATLNKDLIDGVEKSLQKGNSGEMSVTPGGKIGKVISLCWHNFVLY
jgi:hypothetical protein